MNTPLKPMRLCRKCNQDLPKTKDYFTPRKENKDGFSLYCKECINLEKRNKRLEKRKIWDKGGYVVGDNGIKCTICKNIFPPTEEFFGKHKKAKSGLDTYCKPCRRERGLNNYNKNKEKWNKTHSKTTQWKKDQIKKYKEECGGCSKCGEKKYYLLDFHHIDPTTKSFQISQGESKGWEKIKQEIEKCIVLCANCHREFHFLEKINLLTITEYIKKKIT
jgi:hypothetical protein